MELSQIGLFHHTVFDQSPIGSAIYQTNGDVVAMNQSAKEMIGIQDISDLPTPNLFSCPFVPQEALTAIRQHMAATFLIQLDNSRPPTGDHANHKSTRHLEFTFSPINENGTTTFLLAQILDVSARIEKERTLQYFERIYNLVADAICMTDFAGTFIKVNPALAKILGYPIQEIEGSAMFKFIHPDDLQTTIDYIQEKIKEKCDIVHFENRYIKKDGTVIWLSWISQAIFNEQIAFSIAHDITEQKKVEAELKHAKEKAEESERLKTAFICNMSHEIRTPMNGIIGLSDVLSQTELMEGDRIRYAEIINDSCQQLLHIVNDIIDISRIETDQIKLHESPNPINKLLVELQTFHSTVANKRRIDLIAAPGLPDDQSTIWCDYDKLRQIFDNLISNAIKFTLEGYVKFGYEKQGNELCFYVEDTGVGIPDSFKKNMFERFRQADNQAFPSSGGTGLGLSISKAYIEKMGGNIRFTSTKSTGTTFYFTLPYKTAKS